MIRLDANGACRLGALIFRRWLVAFSALLLCAVAGPIELAEASIRVNLLNHRDGAVAAPYYGLRIDNGSGTLGVHTFSFETDNSSHGVVANSTVEMEIFGGPTGSTNSDGHASIFGSVIHNQSGQKWGINAILRVHQLTNDLDVTNWYTGSGNLYDDVLSDLLALGTNVNSLGENHLKDNSQPADKIVFDVVALTLTYMDVGLQSFSLPGQDDTIDLIDFPDGGAGDNNNDPFVITNGHRTGGVDVLTGLGWLIPANATSRSYTQDFLFELGTPFPPPGGGPIPEPVSLMVWGLLFGVGAILTRRSAVRG